jgi:hypothetical protein
LNIAGKPEAFRALEEHFKGCNLPSKSVEMQLKQVLLFLVFNGRSYESDFGQKKRFNVENSLL